jgi:hypothetical protein
VGSREPTLASAYYCAAASPMSAFVAKRSYCGVNWIGFRESRRRACDREFR